MGSPAERTLSWDEAEAVVATLRGGWTRRAPEDVVAVLAADAVLVRAGVELEGRAEIERWLIEAMEHRSDIDMTLLLRAVAGRTACLEYAVSFDYEDERQTVVGAEVLTLVPAGDGWAIARQHIYPVAVSQDSALAATIRGTSSGPRAVA